ASDNGYYALHGGSYHSLIPDALEAYGLQVESVTDRSYEHAAELLSSGHILVALMGHGTLTENGHFVLFTKLLDNGKIYIADPVSYENSTLEWDLAQLLSELKKSYDSGGPLWAVKI
ncbi:MAG: C39 family peptidase, partial [Lachnospiraceae bacterium]|nr:C39 family peptidase [Lachnospiraceae bacterium]